MAARQEDQLQATIPRCPAFCTSCAMRRVLLPFPIAAVSKPGFARPSCGATIHKPKVRATDFGILMCTLVRIPHVMALTKEP